MTKRQIMTFGNSLLAVVALVTAGGWALGTGDSSQRELLNDSQLIPVSPAAFAASDSHPLPRYFTGVVRSRNASDLGFKRTGRLEAVLVDQGDWVTAGQVLAQLDTATLMAERKEAEARLSAANASLEELVKGPRREQIEAARARVSAAEADYLLAESQYQRRARLRQSGAISAQEYDDAVFQRDATNGRLQAAQQELEELETGTREEKKQAQRGVVQQLEAQLSRLDVQLSDSEIKAPFAGRVSRRWLDPGTIVAPGTQVISLVDTRQLEVWVGIPADARPNMAEGKVLPIEIESNVYPGTLVTVLPELNPNTRTLTAVFELDLSERQAPAVGSLARLNLPLSTTQEGYWVETTALIRGERGLWSIYVVPSHSNPSAAETAELQRMDVELLEVDTQQVLVRGPIDSNWHYIPSGVHKLTPGQKVRILSTSDKGQE